MIVPQPTTDSGNTSLHLDECVSAEVEADIPTISDSLEG